MWRNGGKLQGNMGISLLHRLIQGACFRFRRDMVITLEICSKAVVGTQSLSAPVQSGQPETGPVTATEMARVTEMVIARGTVSAWAMERDWVVVRAR